MSEPVAIFGECLPPSPSLEISHCLSLAGLGESRIKRRSPPQEMKETSPVKAASDLVDEIASLQLEVRMLEQILISKYRRVLGRHLAEVPDAAEVVSDCSADRFFISTETYRTKSVSFQGKTTSAPLSPRRSLAEFLHPSIAGDISGDYGCKVSEDVLRCISAVYLDLADRPPPASSPSPSLSSSSSSAGTFSPADPSDAGSVAVVREVLLDADKFARAAKMLDALSRHVSRLRDVDPTKMDHDEQLAFWINVHNALVMHGYLAYGLSGERTKCCRSSRVMTKASYNVGGKMVTATEIQTSVLGLRHARHLRKGYMRKRETPALIALFSAVKKTGDVAHPYALRRPEPLAHFALSAGAASDPQVRLYRGKQVRKKLELARVDYVTANVAIRVVDHRRKKKNKTPIALSLPELLRSYAVDAAVELRDVVEMVRECMPAAECFDGIGGVEWARADYKFGYAIHRELSGAGELSPVRV